MNVFEDGRVEDGTAERCEVCSVVGHLYPEDAHICPSCAIEGWDWTKAMYVRRGDIVVLGRRTLEVDGEEDFGKRVAIYALDGRMWMLKKTEPVPRRSR